MSQKLPPGIYPVKGGFRIDKRYKPEKNCETVRLQQVIKSTAKVATARLEEMMRAEYNRQVNGHKVESKPKTWGDAVAAYWEHKGYTKDHRSHKEFVILSRYIPEDMPLDEICNDTFSQLRKDSEKHGLRLDKYGKPVRKKGNKKAGANTYISLARTVLLYCMTYKGTAKNRWVTLNPGLVIDNVKKQKRKPWILNEDEEERLLAELPDHLERIARFCLNTTLRSGEIVNLKWKNLTSMKGIGNLFIIPADEHKNEEPKPVYLNSIANEIVAKCRGDNDTYVFTYQGKKIDKVVRGAWHKACRRAVLWDTSPEAMERANGQAHYPIMHDLRKLACTRLDNLDMSLDTRQKIMGHTTGNITDDLYTFKYLDPIKKALDMLATSENNLTFLPIAQ